MMCDTFAHINMIRERNPELNFTISAIPAADGYSGDRGLVYAAWGIGISENSEHKAEAWKLVSYLMSLKSTASSSPLPMPSQAIFMQNLTLLLLMSCLAKGSRFFQSSYLANEFVGLPVAEELMRMFAEEIQLMLDGKQTAEEAAAKAQTNGKLSSKI